MTFHWCVYLDLSAASVSSDISEDIYELLANAVLCNRVHTGLKTVLTSVSTTDVYIPYRLVDSFERVCPESTTTIPISVGFSNSVYDYNFKRINNRRENKPRFLAWVAKNRRYIQLSNQLSRFKDFSK